MESKGIPLIVLYLDQETQVIQQGQSQVPVAEKPIIYHEIQVSTPTKKNVQNLQCLPTRHAGIINVPNHIMLIQ
jgi:hypothetical protein